MHTRNKIGLESAETFQFFKRNLKISLSTSLEPMQMLWPIIPGGHARICQKTVYGVSKCMILDQYSRLLKTIEKMVRGKIMEEV